MILKIGRLVSGSEERGALAPCGGPVPGWQLGVADLVLKAAICIQLRAPLSFVCEVPTGGRGRRRGGYQLNEHRP